MVFRKRYIVNGVINCINLPDFCSDVNCNSRVRKAVCDSRFLGKTRYITSLRTFQPPLSSKYKHSLKTSETNRMLTEIRFTLLFLVSSVLESDLSCNWVVLSCIVIDAIFGWSASIKGCRRSRRAHVRGRSKRYSCWVGLWTRVTVTPAQ